MPNQKMHLTKAAGTFCNPGFNVRLLQVILTLAQESPKKLNCGINEEKKAWQLRRREEKRREEKRKETVNLTDNKKNKIGKRKNRKPPKTARLFKNEADERPEQLNDKIEIFEKA